MAVFNTRLARENWISKYRYAGETELETFIRVATACAEVERNYGGTDEDVALWRDRFIKTLVDLEEVSSPGSGDEIYTDLTGKMYRPLGLNATTGGRITANAGTDYEKATPWNCFQGSEKFITSEGIFSFEEASGSTVTVLTSQGWVEAQVRSFGKQNLQRVRLRPAKKFRKGSTEFYRTLGRSNFYKEVVVTPDHRWILADGTETTNLEESQLIRGQVVQNHTPSDAYKAGFIHGLMFGDGYVNGRSKSSTTFGIRLCGNKAQYVSLFENVCYPPSYDGDPFCSITTSDLDYKDLPKTLDVDYIAGFVEGWSATDGHTHASGNIEIGTQDASAVEWLLSHAAYAGFHVVGHRVDSNMETNYGTRSAPFQRVMISRDNHAWRVDSIEPLDKPETVYCAMVPGEHSFTLEGGVYTGNCFINSPVSNATISYQKRVTGTDKLIDCTLDTDQTPDNLTNIFLSLLEAAETLKSEGGYGINFGFIRPRGSLIHGVGIRHPGVVSYMELWDKMSAMIVKGDNDGYADLIDNHLSRELSPFMVDKFEKKQPRKGAMMAVLPIWHPDIEEYIRSKQSGDRLTKFNISVLVDDAFMRAVEEDEMYDLHFNGEVYKVVKARELYDLIMTSTYNRAEPGILFFDNMNRVNPLIYLGPATATNPCLAKGTLVATEDGLVPVEDVTVGTRIQTTLGFGEVEEIEIHHDIPVYRVEFSDGTVLRATKDHIFHVMQGEECRKTWDNETRLSDLKVGDYVRKEPYRYLPENRTDLTRNDGFLAGYYLGDGSRSERGFLILAANSNEDNTFLREALDLAGFVYHEDHSSEGNSVQFRIQSLQDVEPFFQRLGIQPDKYSHEKTFPDWWLNTNVDFLSGVLDGLIASDGNVNLTSRYPAIRFKSTSPDLHRLFREICLLAGADYKLYKTSEGGETRVIYGREVTRNHDVYEGHLTNDCIRAVFEFTGGLTHPEKAENLRTIVRTKQLNGTKWKVKIQSIELDGFDTVYDLYEPLSDDWNTHGIVSRGCGEIPGSSFLDKGYKPEPYLEPYMDTADQMIGFTTVCLLGSINLTRFVRPDRSFDFEKYIWCIKGMSRLLENVNDTGVVPLPAYDWAVRNIRQYGLGINGLGSCLYMMGLSYGSEEGQAFVEEIHRLKDDVTLETSALLAHERGPFPMYDPAYLDTPYMKDHCKASEETKALARKYGVRNAKRLTNAPLGNSSIICDIVSNGIEPVFSHGYVRTIIADEWPSGLTQHNIRSILSETEVGGEKVWQGEYEGRTWYYEPHNRGLCFIDEVEDFGYAWVKEHFPEDIEHGADYLVSAQDLPVATHVDVQALVQEACDQSVAKTANVPNDYPYEDFKDLYMNAWKKGLVGFTTYRAGTMEAVLATKEDSQAQASQATSLLELLIERGHVPETAEITSEGVVVRDVTLPEEFSNSSTKKIIAEGNKYYLHLSFLPDDDKFPIALWIHSNGLQPGEYVSLNRAVRSVTKLLTESGVDFNLVYDQLDKMKDDSHEMKLGKIIGMALRHCVPLRDIIGAISDIEDDHIASTLTAVRKYLKMRMEDGVEAVGVTCLACGSDNIIYESGCDKCLDCGHAGCG